MTWGMCGAIVMQITSHNRYGHSLRRDMTVVIGLTLFVLMLSGFLASACLQIINSRGPYEYIMSSFGISVRPFLIQFELLNFTANLFPLHRNGQELQIPEEFAIHAAAPTGQSSQQV